MHVHTHTRAHTHTHAHTEDTYTVTCTYTYACTQTHTHTHIIHIQCNHLIYLHVYCVVCIKIQYIHLCIISLQLDVAIGHEMTCQYEQALGMYNDLHLLLEQTIAKHSSHSRPHWLKKMTSSWYQYWDCPNLIHPEKA